MKVEMVRNEVKYDFSQYSRWDLERMYAEEYEHWIDGDGPYCFVRMEQMREEIIKRDKQAQMKKILTGVI